MCWFNKHADQSPDEIVALDLRAWKLADETIAALPLNAPGRVQWWGENGAVTSHHVLVNMTSETQRHAGHADIVRELIDGATGCSRATTTSQPSTRPGGITTRSRWSKQPQRCLTDP
jgi:hypothetical protein